MAETDAPMFQSTRSMKREMDEILSEKQDPVSGNIAPVGATPEEVADLLNITILSVRPRFTELKISKDIIDSGVTRKNQFNKNIIVWRYNERNRQSK